MARKRVETILLIALESQGLCRHSMQPLEAERYCSFNKSNGGTNKSRGKGWTSVIVRACSSWDQYARINCRCYNLSLYHYKQDHRG